MCPLTANNTLSSRRRGHMEPAIWARVLPALQKIGQVQWIGYGETLLHPKAMQYMSEADANGVWSSLTTNGTMLTEQTCAALGQLQHLVHVSVSVDSLDPDTYRKIRKTPLAPVLKGLETLIQHVDRRKITVGSVIMKDNVETLDSLPEYLAGLGLKKYQINVLNEHKGKHFDGELGLEARHALERITAACSASAVQLVVDVPARLALNLNDDAQYRKTYTTAPRDALTRRCLLPWEFPFIDKDGNVFLCSNATGREDELLGSLREDAFMDVWHNDKFQDIRRRFLASEQLPASCRDCTVQSLGIHPLHEYRAEILSGPIALRPGSEQDVVLTVRNTGRTAWSAGEVAVGTARPRDRISPLLTGRWLWVNRVARNPQIVEPGETTTFLLPLAAKSPPLEHEAGHEVFQLVVDGKHWIAGSDFTIGYRQSRLHLQDLVGRLLVHWPRPHSAT